MPSEQQYIVIEDMPIWQKELKRILSSNPNTYDMNPKARDIGLTGYGIIVEKSDIDTGLLRKKYFHIALVGSNLENNDLFLEIFPMIKI